MRSDRLALVVMVVMASALSTGMAQVEPLDQSDLLARAQFAIDSGALESAVPLLEEALERDPFNRGVRLGLVDVLMRLGRGEDAETQAAALRRQLPSDPQVAYVSAAVAFHRLKFEESERLAGEAIERGRNSVDALRLRAFSRFMLENYDGYVEDLKAIIDRDPGNADAYYHLGRFYYENQLFNEGMAALQKSIELNPNDFKALYFLGWCQQAQGSLTEAKESYRKSIKVVQVRNEKYGWPFTDLGDILITEGEYGDGLGWLYQAVRNDPDLPYSRYKYASGLMKEAPTAEVEEQLLTAVRLDPGYTEAFYLLGRYYQVVGEAEKAKTAFARFQQLRQQPEASPHGIKRGR